MKNIWIYVSTFFAGIITGLLIFLKLKDPETVINDNQRVGKIKQRGENGVQNVAIDKEVQELRKMEDRRAKRIQRRKDRKEARNARDGP